MNRYVAQINLGRAGALIADMSTKNATFEELERAINYSKDLIDAVKSYDRNGIEELMEKYQK